ncbi:MAG: hypothetical protein B7W98_03680, partial [Parcubacteria group bacterium 20-58-5]
MNTTEKSIRPGDKENAVKRFGRFIADAVLGVPVPTLTDRLTPPQGDGAAGAMQPRHGAAISTKTACPYCNSTDFVKRGLRQKKHEAVQLYLCRNTECGRTFTAERVKGKRFPLAVILEGISYYNLGLSLEQTCEFLGKKFPAQGSQTLNSDPKSLTSSGGMAPTPATLSAWIEEYKPICRFER